MNRRIKRKFNQVMLLFLVILWHDLRGVKRRATLITRWNRSSAGDKPIAIAVSKGYLNEEDEGWYAPLDCEWFVKDLNSRHAKIT